MSKCQSCGFREVWVGDMINEIDALRAQVAEQRAKIDALMFEYCPEEMTAEQVAEWERHQRVVRDGE